MQSDSHKKTYFFCIGCQKSGTTILARMLDQHPDIACIWEAYFLSPKHESSIFNPDSENWKTHGFNLDDVKRWSSKVASSDPLSMMSRIKHKLTGQFSIRMELYEETLIEALDDFADRCRASVVGDKWPWYIDFIDLMMSSFGDARYIYTVRDPRGIWNSAQRFKGRKRGDEILNEMLKKDKIVSRFLERENFATVRFEDIICEPEKTFEKLYSFLGCNYSESYLIYDPANDPYPDRWDWVPEAGGKLDPAITTKWKNSMTPEQIKKVNSFADWFIIKYDYGI